MRSLSTKTEEEISLEWDRIAWHRAKQIQTREDISFWHVLLPFILELTSNSNFHSVIDIGSGTGFITEELAKHAKRIVGVDLSQEMVRISRARLGSYSNLVFVNSSIEQYAEAQPPGCFTLAVANMMLMTALSLDEVVRSTARLLQQGGHFVFTITHPRYWPIYRQYSDEYWFQYNKEIIIEAPFIISSQKDNAFLTTHIHRPLHQYEKTLKKHGFLVEDMVSLMPTKKVQNLYPLPWQVPRFLGARCAFNPD